MSAAAVIIRRRKQFIRKFRERGAVSADRAIPFGEIGMRRSWIFDRLAARGVFIQVGQDRYYLDERMADAFLAAQRRTALTIAGILLLVFLCFLLASVRW